MKSKLFYLTVLGFSLLWGGGCTQMDYNAPFASNDPVQGRKTDAKFDVGLTAAKAFVEILNKDTSGVLRKDVKEITLVVHNGDTLLYIVNYEDNKGWLVVSGDKRTHGILAYADEGSFETAKLNPGQITWLDDLANQIYVLKTQANLEADTLAADYRLWNNIETYLANTANRQSVIGDPKGPLIFDPETVPWELVGISSQELPTTNVGPLLQTKWGQDSPWNTCVPNYRDGSRRSRVGCVAVAFAQMQYYLHYKLGVPAAMYSSGYCNGWADGSTRSCQFGFSNPTTTTWDQMAKTSPNGAINTATERVAVLMGYTAEQIFTSYEGTKGSSSNLNNVCMRLFDLNLIYDLKVYNYSEVLTSLSKDMPVMVGAHSQKITTSLLGITLYTEYTRGHVWVIDGYENKNIKYTYHYQWYDKSATGTTPVYTKDEQEIITTPNYFYMNWGYDGSWDSGRYTFDGLWNANDGDHQYEREMLIVYGKY